MLLSSTSPGAICQTAPAVYAALAGHAVLAGSSRSRRPRNPRSSCSSRSSCSPCRLCNPRSSCRPRSACSPRSPRSPRSSCSSRSPCSPCSPYNPSMLDLFRFAFHSPDTFLQTLETRRLPTYLHALKNQHRLGIFVFSFLFYPLFCSFLPKSPLHRDILSFLHR